MYDTPTKWTPHYLMTLPQASNVKVTAHVITEMGGKLDFVKRNFQLRNMLFSELVGRASNDIAWSTKNCLLAQGERFYLRSVGTWDPRREKAHLPDLFPELHSDFPLPLDLLPESSYFSSILRVSSGGIQLWPHYDVMDNILIQISGTKRVLLWPPSEAKNLRLHGSSSCVTDIESDHVDSLGCWEHASKKCAFPKENCFECYLAGALHISFKVSMFEDLIRTIITESELKCCGSISNHRTAY